MTTWLRRLLNIRSGEARRTALLYGLYFLLVLGNVWGETASEALFLDRIGTDAYSFRFISEAFFVLVFTLAYMAFVDRIENARLLAAVCVVVAIALVVTGVLLASGMTVAFYLFYLLGRTTRVLFTVHVWTYISDFYNTRAARRVFPVIGSAGRISGFMAGLTLPLVVRVVTVERIPYLWVGLLVIGAWLALLIPRWTRTATPPASAGRTVDVWENFRGGWRAIRESRLLQLLAIGAAAMTVLLVLLNFQADYVFRQNRNADELASLFGLLKGLANALALPFQLFLLTRVVNRVGVGWTNLAYPLLAAASFGLLGFFPLFPLAVLALFVQTALRWGVRNPVDNMLYNAMPHALKGRARAFVNALLVPVATFGAGAMLFLVPRGGGLPWFLFAVGGGVALIYLVTAWQVRSAYRQALVETLAAEDADIFKMAGAEWDAADRAALDQVLVRLHDSQEESTTIFLAQLAYEVGGREALPALAEVAAARGPVERAAILEIVGVAGLADSQVRQLCVDSLADADPGVRRTALAVLEEHSGPEDMPLLGLALDHLQDPDRGVQSRAISLLLRSGDFYYLTAAASALNEMLGRDDPSLRALAVSVLGEMGDCRFVRSLAPHLNDASETVRRAAAQAIAAIASPTAPAWVCELTLEAVEQALSDPTEAVRLAAVQAMGRLDAGSAQSLLLDALSDDSPRVRASARQIVQAMGEGVIGDLEPLLTSPDGRAREAAVLALVHLSPDRYRGQAETEMRAALEDMVDNLALIDALIGLDLSAARLAVHALDERNRSLLDRIFAILSGLHGPQAVDVVRRHLESDDARARANAVEALETITSPLIARFVAPFAALAGGRAADPGSEWKGILAGAEQELGLERVRAPAALERLLAGEDDWLAAIALYLVGEAAGPSLAVIDAPKLISRARRDEVLRAAMDAPEPLVAETARRVARQFGLLEPDEEVSTMLSTIERVIFLREVPFFGEMTVAQLRALAGIAEELSFENDEVIFREGDRGDTLYVVVSGRVGLEHAAEEEIDAVARLATLEPRQYFGEMSIFDDAPRSSSAIAVGQTLLLGIRRAPLIALVEGDPTLALDLIRVLSQRLRLANEQIAQKTKAKPRQLQKLYDQLL